MTKAKAIKEFCLECAGDSAKEVSLCVCGDCQLYPFRFGNGPKTKAYKSRMAIAKRRWPDEFAESQEIIGHGLSR